MSRLERLYAPPEIGAPGKRAAVRVRRDLLLAGLFILAMIAVLVGVLTLVVPSLFGGAQRLYAYFPNADGLDPGMRVSQAGYAIGVLENVEPVFPDPAGLSPCPSLDSVGPCFRAALRIHSGWAIPKDSVVQLASAGLLQGNTLRILPGRELNHPLSDGGRIAVVGREADLVQQLARLTDSLQGLVEDTIAPALADIATQVATLKGLLGTVAGEAQNGGSGRADRLAGIFDHLNRLSADLEAAVDPAQLARILASVEDVSRNLVAVTGTLTGRSQDVQQAVQRYTDLAVDLRGLVKRNRPAIDRSLTDGQYVLQELSASLGPILEHIEAATRNLAELSRDLRNNPAVILQGREVRDNARGRR
jgi:phospholipid/cholesterol/gamma-HCH transport system substrate-binding protein